MATSHVHPLLLLLASLFLLPVLHAIDFQYCDGIGDNFVKVTRVDTYATDNSTLMVFGTTNSTAKAIKGGRVSVGLKFDDSEGNTRNYALSVLVQCPLEPDTNFGFILRDFKGGDKITEKYKYLVRLIEENDDPRVQIERMCIIFDLPTLAASA